MPTAPATLTAAPTSPDRSDRATFSARAVALDDWTKNTHIPELQAAMDNVYANALEVASTATTSGDLVALAAAAANYVGLWSAQTGPLNKPASVSHSGNYWALNTDLTDVTAAGVMQLTRIPVLASSLPSDLVRPITAAFEAE